MQDYHDIQPGDLIQFMGHTMAEYAIVLKLIPNKIYTASRHWSDDDWICVKEHPHYGYPKADFKHLIAEYEVIDTILP